MTVLPTPHRRSSSSPVGWLLLPGHVWPLVSVSVVAIYCARTMDFLPGALLTFGLTVGGTFGVLFVTAQLIVGRWLSTLHGLATGALAYSPTNVKAAIAEIASLPARHGRLASLNWLLGLLFVGGTLLVLGHPLTVVVRIGLVSLVVAVPSILLTVSRIRLRGRALVEELAVQLTPPEVLEILPKPRRRVRQQMIVLALIAMALPVFAVVDLALSSSKAAAAHIEQLPTREERRAALSALRLRAVVKVAGFGGALITVVGLLAFTGAAAFVDPLRRIADEATRIAHGEIGSVRVIPCEDEAWSVASAFTLTHARLADVLVQLRRAGLQIGSTTRQIVATSGRYEAGAAEQAVSLKETAATTDDLALSARQVAESASSVADMAQRTLVAAQAGQTSATAFQSSMVRMREDNQAISSSVVKLSKRVQQIGRIVELIHSVADRSDLLALNADLEGTRAGEVGRAFSLVAAEIRRLAENVMESTQEIEGLIDEIREATQAAVASAEMGLATTDNGAVLAESVAESLRTIVEIAGRTSDAVRAISLATLQQQGGTGQFAEAMADILRVTEQALQAIQEVTGAQAELSALAEDLRGVVEGFRVGEGRARS